MTLAKIFPKKWRGEIFNSEDVESVLYDEMKQKLITRSKLGLKLWSYRKLQLLINASKDETWNLKENAQYLLLWERNQTLSSPPTAVLSFSIEAHEFTRTNRISSITIINNLMWVTPNQRGKGFGRHLAAHFIAYLKECPVNYLFVSKNGIELIYIADFYSKGGERLSNYIDDEFADMKEMWQDAKIGWAVKDYISEADGYDLILFGKDRYNVQKGIKSMKKNKESKIRVDENTSARETRGLGVPGQSKTSPPPQPLAEWQQASIRIALARDEEKEEKKETKEKQVESDVNRQCN